MNQFYSLQKNIKDYIKKNFPLFLDNAGLKDVDSYVDDFLDLDKYTKSTQLFFDFGKYTFNSLSNESNTEEITFDVYLTFRNGKAENLNQKMLDYTGHFYEMFGYGKGTFEGLVDFGIIESISFYPAAEGNENVKIADIQMRLQTEL